MNTMQVRVYGGQQSNSMPTELALEVRQRQAWNRTVGNSLKRCPGPDAKHYITRQMMDNSRIIDELNWIIRQQ